MPRTCLLRMGDKPLCGCRLAHNLVDEAERGFLLSGRGQLWPSQCQELRKESCPSRHGTRHKQNKLSATSGQVHFTDGSGSAHFSAASDDHVVAVPVQWASRSVSLQAEAERDLHNWH